MDNESFQCNYVHLAPCEQIGVHKQTTWELSYVKHGAGVRLIGDESVPFSSGDLVFVPRDTMHCWYFSDEVTDNRGKISNITLTFGQAMLDKCVMAFPELQSATDAIKGMRDAVVYGDERKESIVAVLEDMAHRPRVEQIHCFIQLLLLMVASEGDRLISCPHELSNEEKRLQNIMIYTICNARRTITLDDVAGHVGMNRSSFCVFFKKMTGKTYKSYLIEHRVGLACEILRHKNGSVSNACFQSGFNDLAYFSKMFKRVTGCSPTEYVRRGMPPKHN